MSLAELATAVPSGPETRRPRERIVATARDLFHKHGLRAVGVEAIAEAAGTNKMTLYRHFGSKDELICAYLKGAAADMDAKWAAVEEAHRGDPRGQLRAWIREGAACIEADGRGCDLANAAVELTEPDHPARRLIEDVKGEYRDRLAALCGAAGAAQPELLADTLCLLHEGARVCRQSVGAEGPSARFMRIGEAVIDAFLAR